MYVKQVLNFLPRGNLSLLVKLTPRMAFFTAELLVSIIVLKTVGGIKN